MNRTSSAEKNRS